MIEVLDTYGLRLASGLWTTIELVVIATVLGFVLAVPLALARVARNPLISGPAYAYVFVFRGTPLLIQLFIIYYGSGQIEAIQDTWWWPHVREHWGWICGIIGLTLNTAAYTAEIVRGGILGIPHGEVEAARACGMTTPVLYRRIILPRAFRIAWPAYGNEIVFLIKGSVLVSTITVLDLMGQARAVFSRNLDLNTYMIAGVFYFVMVYGFDRVWRAIEARINRHLGERPGAKQQAKAKPA
ncbi:MAG: ABC transporter permease [Alphaproteobacteria bacterium]|nr:ABC transporter permease [Alphaproteobacteria bacterium]